MMCAESEEENDWDWDADQPKQYGTHTRRLEIVVAVTNLFGGAWFLRAA